MRQDPRRRDPAAYPWQTTLDTRFGDLDPNRHLNNVAIARLFEEVRVRFHAMLYAQAPADIRPRFLVAHTATDYIAEGRYPAPAVMTLAILSIGTSSYRVGLGLFQDGDCIALCDTVLVHRGETAPSPLPPTRRVLLEAYALKG